MWIIRVSAALPLDVGFTPIGLSNVIQRISDQFSNQREIFILSYLRYLWTLWIFVLSFRREGQTACKSPISFLLLVLRHI